MEWDSTYYKKQYFIQYLYQKVQANIITILQDTLIGVYSNLKMIYCYCFYCYSYFIVIIVSSSIIIVIVSIIMHFFYLY